MKRANRGFTLLELVATVAIVAILIGLVAPSFSDMILNNRQTGAVNDFIRAVHLGRSEAAKRAVTLKLSATDASSSANEWGNGWTLWEDKDNDNTLDSGEAILTFANFPEGVTMDSHSSTVLIEFSPTGRITMKDGLGVGASVISTTTEYLQICDRRTNEKGKKITFSTVGQPTTVAASCS